MLPGSKAVVTPRTTLLLVVLSLLLLPEGARGQVTDVLLGTVVALDGAPLSGVRITADSPETGVRRTVVTDARGRYLILIPDGVGHYELRASILGFEDQVTLVTREPELESIVTHFVLLPSAILLEGIQVIARIDTPETPTAGERVTTISQEEREAVPVQDDDPATLALFSPGAVASEGDTLEGRPGFSMGGLPDALNDVSLDGSSIGGRGGDLGSELPREGIRQTRIIATTFDVSRGGFAGGQISLTTARGRNESSGSSTYQFRDPRLQGSAAGSDLGNAYRRHRLSGGYGGAIVQDRLFYHLSFTLQRQRNQHVAMPVADPAAARRTGVHADSVGRFVGLFTEAFQLPLQGLTGPYVNQRDNGSILLRTDYNVTEAHSVMLRADVNRVVDDSTRISPLDLHHNGGEQERSGGGAMLQLTSRLRGASTNELRIATNRTRTETLPYLNLPEGRVRVASEFEDETRSVSTLTFGGDRVMPTERDERAVQLSNEFTFGLRGTHQVTVGLAGLWSRSTQRSTDNSLGTFQFNSLEDFEANLPSSYTRALTERETRTGGFDGALFVGDTWRPQPRLQLTYGVRVEYSDFAERPELNPAVLNAFQRRTDLFPSDAAVSPRLGISYRLSAQGAPTRLVRGGVGEFRGRAPFSLLGSALRQTGLEGGELQLSCVGESVPLPDWASYLADPSTVPTTCLSGEAGSGGRSTRRPNVTVFAPDFGAPRSWKFSVGFQNTFPGSGRLTLNADYTLTRGVGLYGVRDLNLDEENWTTLPREVERTFFGDPERVVVESGSVPISGSRLEPEFAGVYEVFSGLRSRAHELQLRLNGTLPYRRIDVSGSYTVGVAHDQSSFSTGNPQSGFVAPTTAGNPNRAEWGTGNNDRRHNLAVTLRYPVRPWAQLVLNGRLQSGLPFTPLVGGDVNGDGARNDRAYLFHPLSSSDPEVAQGMQRVLDGASGRIRRCMARQLQQIAERNSCRNPWMQTLDLRATLRPELPRAGRRLELSLDLSNVPAALDQLAHGAGRLKGWGQPGRADAVLLYPRGFDPVTREFSYVVNEQFGQTRAQRFNQGVPFQVILQLRMDLSAEVRERS